MLKQGRMTYHIGESGASCNSFYSNPCSVKSVEYRKLLFISSGSPLVALETGILRMTKGCLMSEELNERVTTRPASKYLGWDVTLEGASCKTDLFLILFSLSGGIWWKALYFIHFIPLTPVCDIICQLFFHKFTKNSQTDNLYPHNQFCTWQRITSLANCEIKKYPKKHVL